MRYEHIVVPAEGAKIRINTDGSISVPDQPIIPFIEGDGIGIDVTPAMLKVVNAAVAQGLWRQARHPLDGDLRRRQGQQDLRQLVAR